MTSLRIRTSTFVALLPLLVLLQRPAEASGWTWDPGHFYIQAGSAFSWADRRYDVNGNEAFILVRKFSATSAANTRRRSARDDPGRRACMLRSRRDASTHPPACAVGRRPGWVGDAG